MNCFKMSPMSYGLESYDSDDAISTYGSDNHQSFDISTAKRPLAVEFEVNQNQNNEIILCQIRPPSNSENNDHGLRYFNYMYKSILKDYVIRIVKRQIIKFKAFKVGVKLALKYNSKLESTDKKCEKQKPRKIKNNNLKKQKSQKVKEYKTPQNTFGFRKDIRDRYNHHKEFQNVNYNEQFCRNAQSKEIFPRISQYSNFSLNINNNHSYQPNTWTQEHNSNNPSTYSSSIVDNLLRKSKNLNNMFTVPDVQNCNSEDDDNEDKNDDEDGEESDISGGEGASLLKVSTKASDQTGKAGDNNLTSVLYVDACSLWKFPPWLVERLDLDQVVLDFASLSVERYRSMLMRQLKSTATDLLLYQTVRREFLRTILVIELNNIVKLMEHIAKLGLDNNLKCEFFQRLRPIVSALDNPEKLYIPEMEEMAYVLDELYLLIAPAHVIKGSFAYHFNVIYCSYLVSHWAVSFNENCSGGLVDNNWFANESKYHCMVMVTPQVYEDPSKSPNNKIANTKFRVEAYFDVDQGQYAGFEFDFAHSIDPRYMLTRNLECLIFSYLTREAHWVEDKNIFLLNGPDVKGNIDFTKIYFSLLKNATL